MWDWLWDIHPFYLWSAFVLDIVIGVSIGIWWDARATKKRNLALVRKHF